VELSLDTLAWVGARAVTAADLVRRIEWMPWPAKQAGAGMDSAKVRALQSLAGEQLLAAEAERQGLGDSGSVARMREALLKGLVRDALYRDVVATVPVVPAAEVDRIVRPRASHATAAALHALRRAVADSLRSAGRSARAADFMARVLSAQRATVDSAVFMMLADSLRYLMVAYPDPLDRGPRRALLPDYMEALLVRLGPSLARPLVRLPGRPLLLGEALEEFRFYAFTVQSLDAEPFAAELSARLRAVVEGEWMAREGLRRHLDQRPEVRRDLDLWMAAWRAQLLSARIASGPGASEDAAFRRLALYQPERARQLCEVDVAEILSVSHEQAARLRSRLDAGGRLDSLARRYTTRAEWRSQGGRSGFFPVLQHAHLGYAALLTPADSLCGPLRLPEGHSVFRVMGKRIHPDSLAGRRLLDAARDQATAELRADRVARYVASLAHRDRVEFDYAALRRIDVLPENMLTKRRLGFGGGMMAAPSLPQLWDWVRILHAGQEAMP
jgi:hypothetical protein